MKLTHRPLTALQQRNVNAVSALLQENDQLRERLANRNPVIIVLCMAMIGGCVLSGLT